MGNVIETAQIVGEFIDKIENFNETKQSIKTAIENKGQDLSGVPFTGYASKIDDIQSGESERSIKKYLEAGGTFNRQAIEDFRPLLEYSDTENLTTTAELFARNGKLKYVPPLDTRQSTRMYYCFTNCGALETVPLFDTKKCYDFQGMVGSCTLLKSVPAYDMRSGITATNMFINDTAIEEIWVKNISIANFVVGSGTTWGHLLTQESALHLCKECRKHIKNARTITFATPVYDYLETLYVKLIPITDEMRAEDDLIDEKLPFEVCESTDEGAKSLALYMVSKNWTIAK